MVAISIVVPFPFSTRPLLAMVIAVLCWLATCTTTTTASDVPTTTTTTTNSNNTCGELAIRGIFNQGYIATHKNCTEADHTLLQEAILKVFHHVNDNSTVVRHRNLAVKNCPELCGGLLKQTCIDTVSGCGTWARNGDNCDTYCRRRRQRILQQTQQERRGAEDSDGSTAVSMINLDEIFQRDGAAAVATSDHNNNDDGQQRQLTTAGAVVAECGITEEECIAKKALFYQSVLSALGDLESECANLVLAPALVQCILVVVDW